MRANVIGLMRALMREIKRACFRYLSLAERNSSLSFPSLLKERTTRAPTIPSSPRLEMISSSCCSFAYCFGVQETTIPITAPERAKAPKTTHPASGLTKKLAIMEPKIKNGARTMSLMSICTPF